MQKIAEKLLNINCFMLSERGSQGIPFSFFEVWGWQTTDLMIYYPQMTTDGGILI